MKHPLHWLPKQYRKTVFWVSVLLAVLLTVLFQFLNRPLVTENSPFGIVSLQLAWTPFQAEKIIHSWDSFALQYAAFGLGFDYFYMAVYAIALTAGTLLAAGRHPGRFLQTGNWVAYGCILAAILDGLENLGQFMALFNGRMTLAPIIGVFAIGKFTLLLLGIGYGLIGWLGKRNY